MNVVKSTLVTALGLLGALAGPAAQANGANVQWSVTVGAPVFTLPVPVPVLRLPVPQPVILLPALHMPSAVVVYDSGRYREPRHWDVDGDGIPNRYDRVYNPAWDRNGNGIPDRREVRHHGGHHGYYGGHYGGHYGPHGDRDHDGIPNRYDRRDDRYDGYGRGARDPRHERRDDRYDSRRQPQ